MVLVRRDAVRGVVGEVRDAGWWGGKIGGRFGYFTLRAGCWAPEFGMFRLGVQLLRWDARMWRVIVIVKEMG